MYSVGEFCPISITMSSKHNGLTVWCVRNPKYRVDTSGVLVNTIESERRFSSGNGMLSPMIPVHDLIFE